MGRRAARGGLAVLSLALVAAAAGAAPPPVSIGGAVESTSGGLVFPDGSAQDRSPAGPGPVPLPQTGQQGCWDESGASIGCAGTGQDGELRKGLAWPTPRFTDNGDGTVNDGLTGLVWLQDQSCFGLRSWTDALADAGTLAAGACGLSDGSLAGDWRLPNVRELLGLVDYRLFGGFPVGPPFGIPSSRYWSSTSSASSAASAFEVGGDGSTFAHVKSATSDVWPVRSGAPGPAPVPDTGQQACADAAGILTSCFGSGQDGESQAGHDHPTPRFTANGDGTVTDNLTRLVWLQQADCLGTLGWSAALMDVAALGSGRCGLDDGSTAGEWRLPNIRELESLLDHGRSGPPIPAGHPFTGVPTNGRFWSSSTAADLPGTAWALHLDGFLTRSAKPANGMADPWTWPVRDGS